MKATKAPEGATTGAVTGGVTGGVLGLLAGIGALAIPGVGPFIAAGPIMAALSGAAIGGATGGVVGGLIGLGIPEIEAKRRENSNPAIISSPSTHGMTKPKTEPKRYSKTRVPKILRPRRCHMPRPLRIKSSFKDIDRPRAGRCGAHIISIPAALNIGR